MLYRNLRISCAFHQKYVPTYAVGCTESDEGQDSHEKQIMKAYLKGKLLVPEDIEPVMGRWIREGMIIWFQKCVRYDVWAWSLYNMCFCRFV